MLLAGFAISFFVLILLTFRITIHRFRKFNLQSIFICIIYIITIYMINLRHYSVLNCVIIGTFVVFLLVFIIGGVTSKRD